MKRLVRFVLVVLVIVVAVVGGLVAYTFMGRESIVDGFEINGIRVVRDGIVSLGVVSVGHGQVALVDAGNDKKGEAILGELARRKLDKSAVVAILLTHGHPDHTGALALFPGVPVMALAAEAGLVEGTEGARGPLTRLMPVHPTGVKVTRPLEDGQMIVVGDTPVQVFAVPGHTQGSAAYLLKNVLFVGDAADAGRGGVLIGSPWIFSDSQPQDRASLVALDRRLVQSGAQVKAVIFAHSGVRSDGLSMLTAFAQQQGQ